MPFEECLEREGSMFAIRDRSSLSDRCIRAPMLESRLWLATCVCWGAGVWCTGWGSVSTLLTSTSRKDTARSPTTLLELGIGCFGGCGAAFVEGSPFSGFGSVPAVRSLSLSRSARNLEHERDQTSCSSSQAAHLGLSALQLEGLPSLSRLPNYRGLCAA